MTHTYTRSTYTRRQVLGGLGAAAGAHLLSPTSARAEVKSLTILHTNDIHARLSPMRDGRGGLAYLAAALDRERAKSEACLYLEAGDFVQGTPVSSIFEGVPVYEVMNRLRPDAVCVGNHEFDYGWERIYDYLKVARYPMFCANLVNSEGTLLTPPPYLIREVNGIKIAIIGLIMESLAQLTYAYNLGPWRVQPLVATAQKYIRRAKEVDGAQLIIGLAHIFPKEEAMLLEALPEMHLIVSGHDHGGMKQILRDGNRMVVRTRPFGAELGRVDLKFDTSTNQVTELNWERFEIKTEGMEPEPEVAKEVAYWESRVSKIVDREIGQSKTEYNRWQMKDVVERAMKEMLGCDFAFVNRGGVRAGLPVGAIHAREIWDALPFGNRVVTGKIPGKLLPESIKRGANVEPEQLYTVATIEYVAANQREIETEGLLFPEVGPYLRELVIEWVEKHKVVE